MIKRISGTLLVFIIFFMASTNVFAIPLEGTGMSLKEVEKTDAEKLIDSVLANADGTNTEELYIKIDSPKKDEKQSEKKFAISGSSEFDDVIIALAKYNESKKVYEPMVNTDGESSWAIGNVKMFSKKINLEAGVNKIKIIAYRTSKLKNISANDIQQNCYTLELVNKSALDNAIQTGKNIVYNIEKTWNSILGKSGSASE